MLKILIKFSFGPQTFFSIFFFSSIRMKIRIRNMILLWNSMQKSQALLIIDTHHIWCRSTKFSSKSKLKQYEQSDQISPQTQKKNIINESGSWTHRSINIIGIYLLRGPQKKYSAIFLIERLCAITTRDARSIVRLFFSQIR